jgi:L-2,4-diaminobutyrate decarboxylase
MNALDAAFDPETFRAQAHAIVDQLADYLRRAEHREMPVLPPRSPADAAKAWPPDFAADRAPSTVEDLIGRVLSESNHFHHPRNVGHQVAAPLPLAAICDFVAALLNNGMAVYETGPVSTVMDRAIVQWLASQVGFPPGADGVLTSGGSAGNLTALLGARQATAGFDAWNDGLGGSAGPSRKGDAPLPCLLTSEQTHYCVARAVKIMGWGAGGIRTVATDAQFRLRADALDDAQREAERAGRRVVAIVASAGSTSTGAYDPLHAIADFCQSRGIWMHVDGAHGACAALSKRHAQLVAGLERADSFVVDAHKMLLMPALLTAVVFRDGRRSYEAFSQSAAYLFQSAVDPTSEWFNMGTRTLECTKRMMSLKLYVALRVLGPDVFAEHIERTFALTARFAAHLQEAADFEVATPPEGNILCFRYTPPGVGDLDALQARIRQRLLAAGDFYVVQTRLRDSLFLRTTIINPLTTDLDLVALAKAVRAAA